MHLPKPRNEHNKHRFAWKNFHEIWRTKNGIRTTLLVFYKLQYAFSRSSLLLRRTMFHLAVQMHSSNANASGRVQTIRTTFRFYSFFCLIRLCSALFRLHLKVFHLFLCVSMSMTIPQIALVDETAATMGTTFEKLFLFSFVRPKNEYQNWNFKTFFSVSVFVIRRDVKSLQK